MGKPPHNSVYSLPFPEKTELAHFNRMGLNDFQFYLPAGTPILASRSGVVEEARRERYPRLRKIFGLNPHDTNYVIIDHGDGTTAKYIHVEPSVREGTEIKTGDLLGVLYGHAEKIPAHIHFWGYTTNSDEEIPVEFPDID